MRLYQLKIPAQAISASVPSAYPGRDVTKIERMGSAAWFKDSKGNIMCLDDAASAEHPPDETATANPAEE